MRHLKAGKRLGITTSHRKALMRNLVTSLLEHKKICTTLTRAKEMRREVDRVITWAKKGDLAARRQALKIVKTKLAMKNLFEEYNALYKDRNGGYTQIFRLGNRLGDNAELAMIRLVDTAETETKQASPTKNTKKKADKKDSKAKAVTTPTKGAKKKTD